MKKGVPPTEGGPDQIWDQTECGPYPKVGPDRRWASPT